MYIKRIIFLTKILYEINFYFKKLSIYFVINLYALFISNNQILCRNL